MFSFSTEREAQPAWRVAARRAISRHFAPRRAPHVAAGRNRGASRTRVAARFYRAKNRVMLTFFHPLLSVGMSDNMKSESDAHGATWQAFNPQRLQHQLGRASIPTLIKIDCATKRWLRYLAPPVEQASLCPCWPLRCWRHWQRRRFKALRPLVNSPDTSNEQGTRGHQY